MLLLLLLLMMIIIIIIIIIIQSLLPHVSAVQRYPQEAAPNLKPNKTSYINLIVYFICD